MSSEKFESLEEDLISIIDELKVKIDRKIPHYVGEEKKSAIRQCERNLEEASIIIQDMESEAKLAPINYRTQMLGKIRIFRGDLEQMTRSLKKDSLIGTRGSDNYGFDRDDRMEASQRAKLLQGHQSLQRASESIARSQQISAETDQIGVEVIDNLGQQRESLVRTRERLSDTDANLGRSRKILKGMARRVMTNKMVLAVIILFELATLGGLVYWKFFS
ncbi:vesicle transport through interaction with t-SNAREs homolog 1B-like [Gigantopelta aegis]|uniref:vesicle transport through interaction with t-SNAREs homolog 1B-like n=1 Tax=Gigantopelta aegis TaxID=1735272 RepID=UPI001B88DC6D|nr:vesicle transport through interaction with t-SNAREs homolog 1B-like [Gigantopelta aegis]